MSNRCLISAAGGGGAGVTASFLPPPFLLLAGGFPQLERGSCAFAALLRVVHIIMSTIELTSKQECSRRSSDHLDPSDIADEFNASNI